MTKKIFRTVILSSVLAAAACLIIITCVMYGYFTGVEKSNLKRELGFAVEGVNQGGEKYLEALNSDTYRLTWVDKDGTVLFDSEKNPSEMENHLKREEIKEALTKGTGSSERFSTTLTQKTIYSAQKIEDGTVLRISIDQASVIALVLGMLQPVIVVFFIVLILAALLAHGAAKHIVSPLNTLDLEHPLENDVYEEISPLLIRINELHKQVERQMRELKKNKDEFEQVIDSMQEGLVILDNKGVIISINHAASKLFMVENECIGKDFLAVDRGNDINSAIQKAVKEGHGEIVIERKGYKYQLDANRIESEGKIIGSVLLVFDVTEKLNAEQNRKEFTANISHELKTPLQSIMGSAELMENGLVKPEDTADFISRIRTEAARLVALIEDIIRLSQLDEGVSVHKEDVDLTELAEEAADELEFKASKMNVKLYIKADERVVVKGSHKLLSEVIYNLCDNAIKYNIEHGTVDIIVKQEGNFACIQIKDTGIGIPEEAQPRIFERFYRVDKSHSGKSKGTGLGLSIVKHAVLYHNGTIEVQSDESRGSCFTVKLPM